MIFNITGGGGGSALNFNVVAYNTEEELLAATPSENTIGVITETPMISWLFSSTEPNPATPGMVWITTGTYIIAAFNALKKNGIQVCPISAQQYVGGAWVRKTAKIYQVGAWVDWIDESLLYRYGDENIEVTGGWATGTPVVFGTNFVAVGSLNITRNEEGITASETVNYGNSCLYISKLIDLTDYNTLYFSGSMTSSRSDYGWLGIWSEFATIANDNVLAKLTPNLSMGTHIIDVTGINQKCRIGFYIFHPGCSVTMREMWLE